MGALNAGVSKQMKLGAILSYGRTILHIVISLVYTPLMLNILGQNEYGLYSMAVSTISMLSILDLGFSSSYVRYYSLYRDEGKAHRIPGLNGLFFLVYVIISIAAFLCGMYFVCHLELVFDAGLTPDEMGKARIMLLILTINIMITFLTSVFTSFIRVHEKFIFMNGISLLQTICNPLVQLPFLFLGYGSVGMTIAIFLLNCIITLFNIGYSLKKLSFKFAFKDWEKGLFRSIFFFSGIIAINLIVDQINNNLDNILLARYCGTAEVAVNAIGATFCMYYMTFSTAISNVFVPRVHRIVNETKDRLSYQREVLTGLFTKVGRIQFLLLALIMSGFVFFGADFIALWAGDGYEDSYWVAIVRMLPSTVPLIQNMGIEIQRAKNLHHHRSYIYLGMAILNLISTVIVCQHYGAIGAAVCTGVTTLIAPVLIMNILYHKMINIDMFAFWKSIARQLRGMIVPFVFGTVLMIFFTMDNVVKLALGIFFYLLVYVIFVWRFSMNSDEKGFVTETIKKFKM